MTLNILIYLPFASFRLNSKKVTLTGVPPVSQTLDELGSFRLTTKLPEYLACGVPVAMSPIPGFYDYAASAGWALPAYHPASKEFHLCCARWLDNLPWQELEAKAKIAPEVEKKHFDYDVISDRFADFIAVFK